MSKAGEALLSLKNDNFNNECGVTDPVALTVYNNLKHTLWYIIICVDAFCRINR